MNSFSYRTEIPGLYLTGQDTLVAGFIFSVASGFVSACAMLCERGGGAAMFLRFLANWWRGKWAK